MKIKHLNNYDRDVTVLGLNFRRVTSSVEFIAPAQRCSRRG